MAWWSFSTSHPFATAAIFVGLLGVGVFVAQFKWRESVAVEKAKQSNANANLTGTQSLVFGGTAGIGEAMALRLAQGGSSVTIVGRNQAAGRRIVSALKERNPKGKHDFIAADLMSLQACNATVATFMASAPSRLDYVVYCQTIATTQGRTPTSEGIDQKLALNYFSRVHLTELLLPLLKATAQNVPKSDPRVMSVLSAGVHGVYAHWKDDPLLSEKHYTLKAAADTAGFYTDLWLDQKARSEPSLSFVHASPGFVATNWGTEMPLPIRYGIRFLQAVIARRSDRCAELLLQGLTAPQYRGGLHLIGEFGQPVAKTSGHTVEARNWVWEKTLALIQR